MKPGWSRADTGGVADRTSMPVRKDDALVQGAMMRESDLPLRWMLQVRHGFSVFEGMDD